MNNTKYFSIDWRTFDSHLLHSSKELLNEKVFTDVTLVSDDMKTVRAHRIILSRASEVFKQLLELNPSSSPLLYLNGISYENLNSILEFIYAGQTQVPTERINEFIKASYELEIKELSTNKEFSEKNKSIPISTEQIENAPLQRLNNERSSNVKNLGDASTLMIENAEFLVDVNGKLTEEEMMEEKKKSLQSKKNRKIEKKSSFNKHIKTVEVEDKVSKNINQNAEDIKRKSANLRASIESMEEKNNTKAVSKVKQETIYKVEDLACSRCFELFSEQISYLKHMANC